jgi:hypothetical protein
MSKVKGQRGNHSQQLKATKQKREYFDQEEENFDAMEMGEHEDPEYHALLKSSAPHANKRKNAYFFEHDKYKGSKQQPEEEEVMEDESEEESEDQNQIAGVIKTIRQERKKESKLLT